MSNLSNLIQGMLANAIGQHSASTNQSANGNGLGDVLGGLINGQNQQNISGGLGGMLGSVLSGLGGNHSTQNTSTSNAPNNAPNSQTHGMSKQAKLLVVLVPFVLAWIQKQGGFHNAIKVLTQSGMGQQAQSWVSNGANEPVDSAKIATVFDDNEVEKVANQANTSKSEVYNTLADLLPQIVNSITSNGQVQGNGSTNQIQQVMNMLGGLKF